MKAVTLSISIPERGCDKNCPYCISKMTGNIEQDIELMTINTPKVQTIAKASGVTCVSMTGKGEPTLNWEFLKTMISEFSEWPVELQTNGIQLLDMTKRNKRWTDLFASGLNVVAISIDRFKDIKEFSPVWEKTKRHGGITRATINISNKLSNKLTLGDFIEECKKYNVDQLTFRQLRVPDNNVVESKESWRVVDWIDENVMPVMYNNIQEEIIIVGRLLYTLPYDAAVFDVDGISVTAYKCCMQEKNAYNDIRALIFQQDGHLYMTWNSKASVMF